MSIVIHIFSNAELKSFSKFLIVYIDETLDVISSGSREGTDIAGVYFDVAKGLTRPSRRLLIVVRKNLSAADDNVNSLLSKQMLQHFIVTLDRVNPVFVFRNFR